ncbi:hypothetical protein MPTK1_5g04030 [Marchantia polymorpha subsp. ruderalis]|uniref:Uncharacterized protein n=2 Tax=Marchantia polymorpha TaxID=3197 RepID=A0AAF6BER4_MARPO|nr:hypothetical protein MARPO_0141s0011 [Marchantia polymorpha]BBN10498.1 hypothetical protein Mp_5g04030 [Marchantia polymorpha subsp. ruderalis]|eukprot:PTQ29428.1 hypothetical protein MARPO_0141s0011 [Marchantia polymorpha]
MRPPLACSPADSTLLDICLSFKRLLHVSNPECSRLLHWWLPLPLNQWILRSTIARPGGPRSSVDPCVDKVAHFGPSLFHFRRPFYIAPVPASVNLMIGSVPSRSVCCLQQKMTVFTGGFEASILFSPS